MRKMCAHLFMTCAVFFAPEISGAQQTDSVQPGSKQRLLKTSGNISLGYDYGVLPFAITGPVTGGYFRTDGLAQVSFKDIPFDVQYYYSTLKNISGLNNYFRVSFNAQQYRETYLKKIEEQKGKLTEQLKSLQKQKQIATQKLLYFQHKVTNFKPPVVTVPDSITNFSVPEIPDTSEINFSEISDTANINAPQLPKDTLCINKPKIPVSLDSLHSGISYYENQITQLEQQIEKIHSTIELAKNPNLSPKIIYPQNKFFNLLMAVKKFDVGLCYPNHSTFLINGIALRGINAEFEKNKMYFAFTHGKTINNLLHTNNLVQNNLQNFQNLYNFFDFNNVNSGRRITAVKFGYGNKTENHIHLGMANGLGKESYFTTEETVPENNSLERNWVFEMDGKLLIKKYLSIDAIYGKSSVQLSSPEDPQTFSPLQQLFDFKDRSNAALIRLTSVIEKTKTKITASGRIVDPFFRSFGVGFIRSDNFRYEFKAEQAIGKKVKVNASYRREQDNLLNLFYTQNTLQTFGAGIHYKVNKYLNIKAGYNPVIQQVKINGEQNPVINNSNISFVAVNYHPKTKKSKLFFTALYNYYHLVNGTTNNEFSNVMLVSTMETKKIQNSLSANAFYTNASDTLLGNTYLAVYEIKIPAGKKINLSATAKWADNSLIGNQWGYAARLNYRMHKNISWEISGEKLIFGDFYNSIGINQLNSFPYYCYTRVLINW